MSATPHLNEEARERFLELQMGEAWAHYRHCETMRTQYLTVFSGGYVAATGFVVALLKSNDNQKPVSAETLFGIAVLVAVLFCFSTSFFILTVRLNQVLAHYGKIMERTRQHFFGKEGLAADIWSYRDVGLHPLKPGLFSVGAWLVNVIAILTGFLVIVEATLAIILTETLFFSWLSNTVITASVAMGISIIYLVRQERKLKKITKPKPLNK